MAVWHQCRLTHREPVLPQQLTLKNALPRKMISQIAPMMNDHPDLQTRVLLHVQNYIRHVLSIPPSNHPTLPTQSNVQSSTSSCVSHLPEDGLGLLKTMTHLIEEVAPGLNASSLSPNYYGFVTGGTTPAARIADHIVTLYDQNVMVHLPDQSVATVIEDRALQMLQELLRLDPVEWRSRTFTTGATGGNVLGLACGREFVVMQALQRVEHGWESVGDDDAVGELGMLEACRKAGIDKIQVLATAPHSSLRKAASVVGLGRSSVHEVARVDDPLAFDMEKLEDLLGRERTASIVAISCSEVNTGGFATHSREEVFQLRQLCDKYGAWLHVDGAFGIFARTLEGPEFEYVASGARYLELADSISGDGHKLLNVPYDCGFFFCRHPNLAQEIFRNPNAAYLKTEQPQDGIPGPLNISIENSRRFRGLPVYTSLTAYGRSGYVDMLGRQIRFARAVARFIDDNEQLELLPEKLQSNLSSFQEIFIIVLFRAKDIALNRQLVKKINATLRIYVSGTEWKGEPATRVAVSNWQVDVERDLSVVESVLQSVLTNWRLKAREELDDVSESTGLKSK